MRIIKKHLIFLFSFFLISCQNSSLSKCYQCYFGKMYLSSGSMDYNSITKTEIIDKHTNSGTHFGNIEIISENEEALDFLLNENYHFSAIEISKNLELDSNILIYFFVQIPKGYEAFKRNNVQGHIKEDDGQILLTDNFYYYASRDNQFYCDIDIKENKEKEESVFAFYFSLSKDFLPMISNGKIRLIYNLSDE